MSEWYCTYCGYTKYEEAIDNRGGSFIVCCDCGAAWGNTIVPKMPDSSDDYVESPPHENYLMR